MRRWLIPFVSLGLLLGAPLRLARAEPVVSYVPEMAPIPAIEELGPLSPGYALSPAEEARWPQLFAFVAAQVSDKVVQDLSRWARDEMKAYHYAQGAPPKLEALGTAGPYVVYAVTLDVLPSHSRAVKRWLSVYPRCRKTLPFMAGI